MNILISSLGSIGCRHLANLREIRPSATIHVLRMTDRPINRDVDLSGLSLHRGLNSILDVHFNAAILCSPAPMRGGLAMTLLERRVPVLIEKPIADNAGTARQIAVAGQNFKTFVAVAYQMRCLPLMQAIKLHVESGTLGRLLSIRASVGQYLPAWRPSVDYRSSVSACADLGGGVLLELSHEIDYILWLFGMPKSVTATAKRIGDLEIDVADFAEILLNYGDVGPVVSLHLDFLDQMHSRTCRILGTKGTLFANFINGELSINSMVDSSICLTESYPKDSNQAYLETLRRFFDRVEGAGPDLPSAFEAASVLEIVEAASLSSALGQTIKLG